MTRENAINPHQDIIAWIERQTEIDLETIADDPQNCEFYTHVLNRYRLDSYSFLSHLDSVHHPRQILYPACGFDRIPKLVFQNRLLHTSLENHGVYDSGLYCTDLSASELVIADNQVLPFPNLTFDALLLLDTNPELILPFLTEFNRVLKPSGLIVLYDNYFTTPFKDNRLEPIHKEFRAQSYPVSYWHSTQDQLDPDIYFTPHVLIKLT